MADWKHLVRARLKPLGLTASAEAALAEEIAEHLEDLHADLVRAGLSEAEADAEVAAELTDVDRLRAGVRRDQRLPSREAVPAGDPSVTTFIAGVVADVRYALRTMRKKPAFVFVVVAVLGVGMGATTTVFTAVNTLLLNPMSVPASSELVAIGAAGSRSGAQGRDLTVLSYPNFKDYQRDNGVFASMAGFTPMRPLTWRGESGASQALLTEFVTGEYFSTLGVGVSLGRTFGPEVDVRDGREAVAVLNFGTWQRHFGSATDVIGREIDLNGSPVTVVGVASPGFIGVNGLVGPELWVPLPLAAQLRRDDVGVALRDRGKPLVYGVGRLREGATLAQAQASLRAVASALADEYPHVNSEHSVTARPIADLLFGGGSEIVSLAGIVLACVAGIVLLIACSNAANLLLARGAARRHEIAVRLALGASAARVVRQLLIESLCFGLMGGVVGLLAAAASKQLLASTLPPTNAFVTSTIQPTVLLFAFASSVVAGVMFGTIPALSALRGGVAEMVNGSRTVGGGPRRVFVVNVLLVGQVALSFLLLITAALFVRSIQRAYEIDPGFEPSRLAVFITTPGQAGYTDAQVRNFYRQVRERVDGLPGVDSVSWASNMPLFARPLSGLRVEGQPGDTTSEASSTIVNTIDRGYFSTAVSPIVSGREFMEIDTVSSTPVVIVNDKLVRDFWPGDNPLGKRLQVPGESQLREVVGVARDANYSTWGEPPQRCVYIPLAQNPLPSMTLYVRSAVQPEQVVNAVRREINAIGPEVLVAGVRTGQQVVDGSLFQPRMAVILLGAFGLTALILACIGLYGILTFAIQERRREIGLRMALGASKRNVLKLVVKQGMTLVGAGLLIGLAAALMTGRAVRAMLYNVAPTDPASLVLATVLLCGVALAACYVPARRAAGVDPLNALRHE
jgi:macrolide transport system ATP-binding/permease protein